MKKLLLVLPVVLLASCSMGVNQNNSGDSLSGVENSGGIATITPNNEAHGQIMTVNYTLRDTNETGTIIETTIESVAKENGIYMSGMTYAPIVVRVGVDPSIPSDGVAMSVIPGFEDGLKGLKAGDKKGIVVPPEKGYGTGAVETAVPRQQVEPEFTLTEQKSKLGDTVQETVEKSQFPAEMLTTLATKKVGDNLTGANGVDAKIINITDKDVTLEFKNTQSPFYGKELAVGLTGSDGVNEYTITKIDGDNVSILVKNNASPFAGKSFAVGTEATNGGNTLKITAINDDTVTIAQTTPMTGKTLYFDVDVVKVEDAATDKETPKTNN